MDKSDGSKSEGQLHSWADQFLNNQTTQPQMYTTTTTLRSGALPESGVPYTYRRTESVPSVLGMQVQVTSTEAPTPTFPPIDSANSQSNELNKGNFSQESPATGQSIFSNALNTINSMATTGTGYVSSFFRRGNAISSPIVARNSSRYTVIINAAYKDHQNQNIIDTQELQFGSRESAEKYANQFRSDEGYQVSIVEPVVPGTSSGLADMPPTTINPNTRETQVITPQQKKDGNLSCIEELE